MHAPPHSNSPRTLRARIEEDVNRLADRLSALLAVQQVEIVQRADSLVKSTFCRVEFPTPRCDSTMKLNGSSGSPAGGGVEIDVVPIYFGARDDLSKSGERCA